MIIARISNIYDNRERDPKGSYRVKIIIIFEGEKWKSNAVQ